MGYQLGDLELSEENGFYITTPLEFPSTGKFEENSIWRGQKVYISNISRNAVKGKISGKCNSRLSIGNLLYYDVNNYDWNYDVENIYLIEDNTRMWKIKMVSVAIQPIISESFEFDINLIVDDPSSEGIALKTSSGSIISSPTSIIGLNNAGDKNSDFESILVEGENYSSSNAKTVKLQHSLIRNILNVSNDILNGAKLYFYPKINKMNHIYEDYFISNLSSEMITNVQNRDFSAVCNWTGTTWKRPTMVANPLIVVDATAKTYTRSDLNGSFITDGFQVGMTVNWSGFITNTANNGEKTITVLTATVMTVSETLVSDTLHNSVVCTSSVLSHAEVGTAATTLSNTYIDPDPVGAATYQIIVSVVTKTADTASGILISFGGTNTPAVLGKVVGTVTDYVFNILATNTGELTITPGSLWLGWINKISVKLATLPDDTVLKFNTNKYSSSNIAFGVNNLIFPHSSYALFKFDLGHPLQFDPSLTLSVSNLTGNPKIQVSKDNVYYWDIDQGISQGLLVEYILTKLSGSSTFYIKIYCEVSDSFQLTYMKLNSWHSISGEQPYLQVLAGAENDILICTLNSGKINYTFSYRDKYNY